MAKTRGRRCDFVLPAVSFFSPLKFRAQGRPLAPFFLKGSPDAHFVLEGLGEELAGPELFIEIGGWFLMPKPQLSLQHAVHQEGNAF